MFVGLTFVGFALAFRFAFFVLDFGSHRRSHMVACMLATSTCGMNAVRMRVVRTRPSQAQRAANAATYTAPPSANR